MDWKLYEEVTKYIYEALGKRHGVKIEGHGRDCKVKGKSGVEHQIDVLTSHSDGVHTYKTAIECKYWKDTVNKDIIMKVSDIIEDAHINKGVIVSKHGFTPDTILFAKYKNIGLVELREIEEEDWEGREVPKILNVKSEILHAEILDIIISNVGPRKTNEEQVMADLKIKLLDDKEIPFNNYLKEFEREIHKGKEGEIMEKIYPLKGVQLINTKTNSVTQINGIKLTGVLTITRDAIKWHPADQIWFIMKSIFEEKTYTISKKGIIKEDKPPPPTP
jgi:hypothetical protein